jgi:hypothetical protein
MNFDGINEACSKFCFLLIAVFVAQAVFAQEEQSDWGFNASVGWSWRQIDGTLFAVKPPLAGLATTDSLGLGSSSEAQATLGMRWKRLGVRLVYLPSEFTGDGTLVQVLDFGNGPVIGNGTPIRSDIKVAMTLANVEYDLLGRADMDWGVGVGFGKVDLDIALVPAVGPDVTISGDVPFGYLTTNFTKRWQKFSASIGVQGLSMSIDNYTVIYKSLSVIGAYNIYSRDKIRLDAFFGYRYVDFNYDFDDDVSGARTNTDFSMAGPNIGLRIAW